MEKSLKAVAINVLFGVSVFMTILNMGCCEVSSSTPLSSQPLSPSNQPLNTQSYTNFNGQPLVNQQLPANSQVGQQFPLVNQPLVNQPGFVNQPFSSLNVQPGLSQPLMKVQPGLNQLATLGQPLLNQPFVNSLAFSGSHNQRLSPQVVAMASCLMMFVLSFLFLFM